MTQDEIIRMALEAGAIQVDGKIAFYEDDLERFAALVAAHEREECAKVCEQGTGEAVQSAALEILLKERKRIAESIRARTSK